VAGLPFSIVDVFAQRKYAGNPLVVVRRAGSMPAEEMQAFARETNFSETTFVRSDEVRDGAFDVRIFTPAREIPFAGHPTLGTAAVLLEEVVRKPVARIDLRLGVGVIPVTPVYESGRLGLLWMRQNTPAFGKALAAAGVHEALGLAAADLDARLPIEEVSTGLAHLVVPVKTLDALRRIKVDPARSEKLLAGMGAKSICCFAPEAREKGNDLSVRVFAHHYGIPEDPATGSANGCLAAYLAKHRVLGGERVDVRVEQGHEVGRPSLLHLNAEAAEEGIRVDVGGRVVRVASGELH